MCKKLGALTANYRWFAIVYIIFMFFMLPWTFVGLTLIDSQGIAMYTFLVLVLLILITIVLLNYLQSHEKFCKFLPQQLQNWQILPKPLRSLDPYDRYVCSTFQ